MLRDVRERGRDIEGCIKQWFSFVKPNFSKYVEPQRNVAGMFAQLSFHPSQHYDDPKFQCIVQLKSPVDKQLPSFNLSDMCFAQRYCFNIIQRNVD